MLNEPHRQLPANTSLAQWFRENGPLLLENPYLRGKNELIANLFLPILEHSQDWQAVGFLNLDAPQGKIGFFMITLPAGTAGPRRSTRNSPVSRCGCSSSTHPRRLDTS
ncbi:hypothetical protein ACFS07_00640 [Undibacterium arcticum]